MGGVYTSLTPTDPWRYSKMPDGFKPRSVEISADKVLLPSQAGKLFYMPLYNGNPTGVKDETVVTEFSLAQNYPNPFNSSSVIRFSVKNPGEYAIEVFSSIGERVTTLFNGWLETGEHRINFYSKELSNGIYLYRLRGAGVNLTKKMIILK
ncbi:MAG: T9SS type A sorting domain-containing protein [Ignavibacteriales bacterium]|nr:T9SS type A sorting domain-containing protein [Ignavibacteriales bacterium]